MDALLSVYGDGRTEHDDGLAALAPALGVVLGGGRWPSSGGQVSCGRARGGRRTGRRVAGDGRAARCEDGQASGLAQLRRARRAAQHRGGQRRPSSGRPRGGRRSRTRVGRRARGRRRVGRRTSRSRQEARSRREARRVTVGGDGRAARCEDGRASGLAQLRRVRRVA